MEWAVTWQGAAGRAVQELGELPSVLRIRPHLHLLLCTWYRGLGLTLSSISPGYLSTHGSPGSPLFARPLETRCEPCLRVLLHMRKGLITVTTEKLHSRREFSSGLETVPPTPTICHVAPVSVP